MCQKLAVKWMTTVPDSTEHNQLLTYHEGNACPPKLAMRLIGAAYKSVYIALT